MKLNFWTRFAINTGLAFAAAVVDSSKATVNQKAAAQKFIAAGQEFINSF